MKGKKSLKEIFRNRKLFIKDSNITNEYIHFIRVLSIEIVIVKNMRTFQLDYNEFSKIFVNNKIINSMKCKTNNKPLVSVIPDVYNKAENLMKSIRSIQNYL